MGRELRPSIRSGGGPNKQKYRYFIVGDKRVRKLATLLLLTFVGPKPYPRAEARHLNDISLDDRLENLAWGTHAENMADAVRNGRLTKTGRAPVRLEVADENDREDRVVKYRV